MQPQRPALSSICTSLLGWLACIAPGSLPAQDLVAAAEEALAGGRTEAATETALEVLARRGGTDPEALALLIRIAETAADGDAQALRTWAFVDASADEQGRWRPSSRSPLEQKIGDGWAELTQARADAVRALRSLADDALRASRRTPEQACVARWARRLSRSLAMTMPALRRALADEPQRVSIDDRHRRAVLKALMKLARKRDDPATALEAASLWHGLVQQASFPATTDDPPSVDERDLAAARSRADQLRKTVESSARIWSVAELEALDDPDQLAFSADHLRAGHPAVVDSPSGRFRIVSNVGYDLTLSIASTIEEHLRRTLAWTGDAQLGKDPVRVVLVPRFADVLRHGTLDWWSHAALQGNRIVARTASIGGDQLGREIAHEIAHLVDSKRNPGLPTWLAEGRAEYATYAFGLPSDRELTRNRVLFWRVYDSYFRHYELEALRRALRGELEDYRDYYTAGYALVVYLETRRNAAGRLLFEPRLGEYLQGIASRSEPIGWFENCFADGKDGRPTGLETFLDDYNEFRKGFYALKTADFVTEQYQAHAWPGESRPTTDSQVFGLQRYLTPPPYGSGLATEAAVLLERAGQDDEAVEAAVWALAVDGPDPRPADVLARLRPNSLAAWAVDSDRGVDDRPMPEDPILEDANTALVEFANLLEQRAQTLADAGRELAANVLRAHAERLPRTGFVAPPADTGIGWNDTWRRSDFERWTPSDVWHHDSILTQIEDAGLHFVADDGSLHVGRTAPRDGGTGIADRTAHQRRIVLRGDEWHTGGCYRIRIDIQPTTSFAQGYLLIGHGDDDNAVKVWMSVGDLAYSHGVSESEPRYDEIEWGVFTRWMRDQLATTNLQYDTHRLPGPRTTLHLEVVVEGGRAEVFVEGNSLGAAHRADGGLIEGYLGIDDQYGAFRLLDVRVRREDATPSRSSRFDVAVPLVDRSLRGILPSRIHGLDLGDSAPAFPRLVVWLPKREPKYPVEALAKLGALGKIGRSGDLGAIPLTVLVPREGGLDVDAIRKTTAKALHADEATLSVQLHDWPALGVDHGDEGRAYAIFVDEVGIAREAVPLPKVPSPSHGLRTWLRRASVRLADEQRRARDRDG